MPMNTTTLTRRINARQYEHATISATVEPTGDQWHVTALMDVQKLGYAGEVYDEHERTEELGGECWDHEPSAAELGRFVARWADAVENPHPWSGATRGWTRN